MKKGLFKKILVAMMCIALTLGMVACGSKKVKVAQVRTNLQKTR